MEHLLYVFGEQYWKPRRIVTYKIQWQIELGLKSVIAEDQSQN